MDEETQTVLNNWGFQDLISIFKFSNVSQNNFYKLTENDIHRIIPETMDCRESFICKFKTELVNINKTIEHNKDNSDNTTTISQINSTTSNTGVPIISLKEKLKKIDEYYSEFLRSRPLFQLLDSSMTGKLILFHYATEGEVLKNDLARIVIDNELKLSLNIEMNPLILNSEKFNTITDSIFQLFSKEKTRGLYFTPSTSVSIQGVCTKKRPSGCLFRAYEILKDKLYNSKLIEKNYSCRRSASVDEEPRKIEVDLSKFHSKTPTDTSDNLLEEWHRTYNYRHSILYKSLSFHEIINKFQIFMSDLAQNLILIDFQEKVKNVKVIQEPKFKSTVIEDKLLDHWSKVSLKIINVAQSLQTVEKSRSRKRICLDIPVPSYSPEDLKNIGYCNALAFLLLPSLITYQFRAIKYQKWKPQPSDVRNSFIIHEETCIDRQKIDELVNERKSLYTEKGVTTAQPYVILCGPLRSIEKSLVIIDDIIYECSSCVQAVDLCFKTFFSFNLDFSYACPHIWTFLHSYMYEIEGLKNTVAPNTINEFIDRLDKITLPT